MRKEHLLNRATGLPVCGRKGSHTLDVNYVTCLRCRSIARLPAGRPLVAVLATVDNGHGGRREGAGRKPLTDGRVTQSYALTTRHVVLLEQYRQRHGLGSSSEALRHLIEQVTPSESLRCLLCNGVMHHVGRGHWACPVHASQA